MSKKLLPNIRVAGHPVGAGGAVWVILAPIPDSEQWQTIRQYASITAAHAFLRGLLIGLGNPAADATAGADELMKLAQDKMLKARGEEALHRRRNGNHV